MENLNLFIFFWPFVLHVIVALDLSGSINAAWSAAGLVSLHCNKPSHYMA